MKISEIERGRLFKKGSGEEYAEAFLGGHNYFQGS